MFNKFKPKSEFSRNVLTLMTGTTIAQAIPIAISPILTRIYSPEDFGVFALYISIVSLISIIVTARYELAIVLPKNDQEAINVFALSLIIMILIVAITTICILVFYDNILNMLNNHDIGNLLYLIPLSILLTGLNQSFNYWSNRKKYFKNISNSQIAQSIGIGVGQFSFGLIGLGYGLILGNIIGKLAALYVLVKQFIKIDKNYLKNIDKNIMIEQMKIYKDFPLVNSLHAFSDIIRISGIVMLISSFFGSTTLGFYALSLRVLQIPISIIGSAFGEVFYQRINSLHNKNMNIFIDVKLILLKTFVIAIPIFLILYIIAPDMFSIVFGEKWRIAGEYSRILTPYLFMNFVVSPISQVPIILKKQKEFFYIALFGNLGVISMVFIISSYGMSIESILYTISIFLAFQLLYMLIWIMKIIHEVG